MLQLLSPSCYGSGQLNATRQTMMEATYEKKFDYPYPFAVRNESPLLPKGVMGALITPSHLITSPGRTMGECTITGRIHCRGHDGET
mmetsp:Transcript_27898/g.78029  ORF Transcript_27898/g.78029 Transcript_27898/m.78029 type:complete len:87 (-) Transcript_27898:588-848(-)